MKNSACYIVVWGYPSFLDCLGWIISDRKADYFGTGGSIFLQYANEGLTAKFKDCKLSKNA